MEDQYLMQAGNSGQLSKTSAFVIAPEGQLSPQSEKVLLFLD